MTAAPAIIAVPIIAVPIAVLLVRRAWGDAPPARAAARWGVAGWTLAIAALVAAGWTAGIWGIACALVAGIGVALALLLVAAWRSPRRRVRTVAATAPAAPEAAMVARRLTVFVLVGPGGFAAAQALAFGIDQCARHHGLAAADATVAGWFVQPVAWAGLMLAQLMGPGPRAMIAPLLLVAGAGAAAWAAA